MARDVRGGDLDDIARVFEEADAMIADLLNLPPAYQRVVLTRWRGAIHAARRRSRPRRTVIPYLTDAPPKEPS